jgi:hypothetical protein
MLRLVPICLLLLLSPLHALPWENPAFGCAANLPEGGGWQPVEAPATPGLTTLVIVQNPSRGAVFGVTALNSVPSANLRDPATVTALESMLRSFGYEFHGNATTTVGGIEWKQYPVKSGAGAQAVTGVVRFTAANGRIFGVTMLLGGGKEAAQDPELQAIASSFRFIPVAAVAAAPTAPTAPAQPLDALPPLAATPSASPAAATPDAPKTESATATADTSDQPDYKRMGIFAGVALVLILMVLGMIGGGKSTSSRR